jgi:hypothetical protein
MGAPLGLPRPLELLPCGLTTVVVRLLRIYSLLATILTVWPGARAARLRY